MIIPIRCFTCGKPVGQYFEEFDLKVNKGGEDAKKVMDNFGLDRYCCRGIIMGHVDLIDTAGEFKRG